MSAFFSQDDLAELEGAAKIIRKYLAAERKAADRILMEPVSISRARATTLRARADRCSDAKQRMYDRLHEIIVACGYYPRHEMCSCGRPKQSEATPYAGHYEIGSGGYNPK